MKSASTQLQSCLYPEGFRCRTKTNKIFSRSVAVFLCFAALFLGQSSYAQTKCPTLNCTAGDVTIESVYLGDASGNPLVQSCVPGTTQTAYLYIVVSSNAPRNGLYFSGTLNGQSLSTCFSNELKGKSTRLDYPTPITYTCGTTLMLTDIFLAFNPGQDNFCTENPTGNCTTIVSSKCSRPPPVVVRAPLVADFTPVGSCPTPGQAFQTFTFSTNITGGTAPYSYTITFGDGTTASGTSADGTETITRTYTSGGSKTVTLSVTDAAGRTDTETKTITVDPCCSFTVTCPAPANRDLGTFNCNTLSDIPAHPTNEATAEAAPYNIVIGNNPCGAIRVSSSDDATPNTCSSSDQTITRTVTIYDDVDNDNVKDAGEPSSTCTFTYTIARDQAAPVAPDAPANVTVQCESNIPDAATLTAQDNCSGTITGVASDGTRTALAGAPANCTNKFSFVRTYTFTDGCGNSSSVQQTITVNDNTAPVAPDAPANVTVQCESNIPDAATLTAQDNCSGTITGVASDGTRTALAGAPANCTNKFSFVRTYTFTDGCGNSSSVQQTITVNDNTAPVAPDAPANVTVQCESNIPDAATLTAQDNCSGTITGVASDGTRTALAGAPANCTNKFSFVRTYTFTDGCGNSSSVQQTITVNDNTAPVITSIPADVTVSCASEVPTANPAAVVASDNCSGTFTVTTNDVRTNGTCANRFTIARTYTATDKCGNASSQTQTITVNDQTGPVITCPANVTVECGASTAPSETGMATATDCGSNITPSYTDETAACTNGSYIITRTFTATDACGNSSSCVQTITVNTTKTTTCFDMSLTDREFDGVNTTFSFTVCAKNCAALSNISFVIPKGIVVVSPASGSLYQGAYNKYKVSVPVSKSQNGIRFEAIGEGLRNTQCETFTFALRGKQTNISITVTPKAGTKTYPKTFDPACLCEQQNTLSPAMTIISKESLQTEVRSKLSVTAAPNPFTDKVRFTIESPVSGQGSLEVFNMLGQKVKTVYQGFIQAGRGQVMEYNVPALHQTNLIYRLQVGGKQVTGKLINVRK